MTGFNGGGAAAMDPVLRTFHDAVLSLKHDPTATAATGLLSAT